MDLSESYHKWHSPSLDRDMEMLVFGYGGQPVILFPTSKGAYYQNKDQGLIESVRWFVENGKIKIYCPDSIDALSWYNKSVDTATKAHNHACYDRMLLTELIPWAQHETGYERVAMAGCSFGGYHAVNAAFRHPEWVSYCFSMSGAFDMNQFTDGQYNDDVYFNNPVDFIPGDNNPNIWRMGVVLGTGEHDICRGDNERLGCILDQKHVKHWLDIRPGAVHDWPVWREQFPQYISMMHS